MVCQQVPHDPHVLARARGSDPGALERRKELVVECGDGQGDLLDIVATRQDEGDECVWYWGHQGG